MKTINDLDLEKIQEYELQIKEIDLALAVSSELIKSNPKALKKIKRVANRQIWQLQAKIDAIIELDPRDEEDE